MSDARVLAALRRMAVYRQADVSAHALAAYALAVSERQLPIDVVEDACRNFESRERAEGETAFPSLGTLLRLCREVQRDREIERRRQLSEEGRRFLSARDAYVPELSPAEARAFVRRFKADVAERVMALRQTGDKDVA